MGNWIVGGLLAIIVLLIIRYLAKQWKAGHGFCTCACKSCGHCPSEASSDCAGSCDGCKKCSGKS